MSAKKLLFSTYPQHMLTALDGPPLFAFVQQLGVFTVAIAAALRCLREALLLGRRVFASELSPKAREPAPAENVVRDEQSVSSRGPAGGEE